MNVLKKCCTTVEYYKDISMDIDGDEVMDVDEEEKMDVDNYNISDFFPFSQNENMITNENLANLFKFITEVSLEPEKSSSKSFEGFIFDDKEKRNSDTNNVDNLKLGSRESNLGSDKIFELPGRSTAESLKMAQYIIDSLMYNSANEFKSSPEESQSIQNSPESGNADENSNETSDNENKFSEVVPIPDKINEEENDSNLMLELEKNTEQKNNKNSRLELGKNMEAKNDLNSIVGLERSKLLECKVILKRIDVEEVLHVNKELEVKNESSGKTVSVLKEPKELQIVEKKTSKTPKKKTVTMGKVTKLTYNTMSSPSSIFSEMSTNLKKKLMNHKNIIKIKSHYKQQKGKLQCLETKSEKTEYSSPVLCDLVIVSNSEKKFIKVNTQQRKTCSEIKFQQILENEKKKLGVKNCSIEIERLPVLDVFCDPKKQTADPSLKICCLCKEKTFFLSKASLAKHLHNEHFDEIFNLEINRNPNNKKKLSGKTKM